MSNVLLAFITDFIEFFCTALTHVSKLFFDRFRVPHCMVSQMMQR